MRDSSTNFDQQTQAAVTVAMVIVLNKPFYPLYVWYLLGHGVTAAMVSLIAVPFFLIVPLLARWSPLAARIALPVIGTCDTLFETCLFGKSAGVELFLAPCILLVALSFKADEKIWHRGLVAFVFTAFLVSRWLINTALYGWSEADAATLLSLNAFSVAGLMAFIALRYGCIAVGEPREPTARR